MDVPTLLNKFDLLIDAPERIPKLREMILQLAVEGKLTAQDSTDESAELLLERIEVAKEEWVNQHDSPRRRGLSAFPDDTPFALPSSWRWARLDDVSIYIQRGKSPTYSDIKEIPVVSQKCVQWEGFESERVRYIDPATLDSYQVYRFLQEGDLLWNSTGVGTVGRVNVYRGELQDYEHVVADSHVTIVRPVERLVLSEYIYVWIASAWIQKRIDTEMTSGSTKQTELNTTTVRETLIPLAPLSEQKRIVARVDELMAYCDHLEAKVEKREEVRVHFGKASLSSLQRAEKADLAERWAFTRKHFDLVCNTPENVQELRQTILQLAVEGKLTEQDPSDEPAVKLLERIEAEEVSEIKRVQALKDVPFSIPKNWAWTRLGAVTTHIRNGYSPSTIDYPTGVRRLDLTATTSGYFDGQYFKYIDEEIEADSPLWLKDGDLLIQRGNSIEYVGIAAIYEGPDNRYIFPDLMMRLKILPTIAVRFIHLALIAAYGRAYFMEKASGTSKSMPKVNQATVLNFPIALPPREQQKRIVAKTEGLMAYCDALERKLERSEEQAEAVLKAVLHAPASQEEKSLEEEPAESLEMAA